MPARRTIDSAIFFDAIQRIRLRLEREPIERTELDRICGELRIPADFDIAQISWKPDYDSFYYNQLRKTYPQAVSLAG